MADGKWQMAETETETNTKIMKKIVIYHSADYDGIFCREIARLHLGEHAEYVGWDYGQPAPKVEKDDELWMLDCCVPGLMGHANLLWIDHHGTSIREWMPAAIEAPGYYDASPGKPAAYLIDGVSACRLAWQWFNGRLPEKRQYVEREVEEPVSVRMAGEYDVWDKRDPNAEVFQFGLRSMEELEWPRMWTDFAYIEGLLLRGQILQGYQQRVDAGLATGRSYDLEWEGLKFLVLNTARCNSLTFAAGIRPEHEGLLGFYFNGRKWKVSLYGVPGKGEVDLSRIAEKHGGGGHRQACGFECERLPWGKK